MGAITNLDALALNLVGGDTVAPQRIWEMVSDRIVSGTAPTTSAPVATLPGRLTSLWMNATFPAGVSATPGAVAAPTSATAGSWPFTDPGGGRKLWLAGLSATVGNYSASANTAGMLILYDRLLHISGLSGTSTSAQTVGGSLTRYTDGVGNWIMGEVYTQIGATARNLTCSYTNSAASPASGRTSMQTVIGGTSNREANRAFIVNLGQGDTGVSAVASATIGVSTGTAGDWGINVIHPLCWVPIRYPGVLGIRDCVVTLPPVVEIKTGACLAWLWLPTSTPAPHMMTTAVLVER